MSTDPQGAWEFFRPLTDGQLTLDASHGESLMRRRKREFPKRKPKQRCEVVESIWGPHEGCAEFMDAPDEHACSEPATHMLRIPASLYLGPQKLRVCLWHARNQNLADDVRIYRYRKV